MINKFIIRMISKLCLVLKKNFELVKLLWLFTSQRTEKMHFSSRLHFAEAHRLNRMQFKCNLLPNSFITSALLMSTLRWPVANGNASHTAQAIISLFAAISLTFQSFQLHFTVHFFLHKKTYFYVPSIAFSTSKQVRRNRLTKFTK